MHWSKLTSKNSRLPKPTLSDYKITRLGYFFLFEVI